MKFNSSLIRHVTLALGLYLGLGVPLLSAWHYWQHLEESAHHSESEQAIHAQDDKGPVLHREHGHVIPDHCSCVYASTKKETFNEEGFIKPGEPFSARLKQSSSGLLIKKILFYARLPARAPPSVTV